MQCSVKGAFDCHLYLWPVELMGSVLCCQAEAEEEVLVRYFCEIYAISGRLMLIIP